MDKNLNIRLYQSLHWIPRLSQGELFHMNALIVEKHDRGSLEQLIA